MSQKRNRPMKAFSMDPDALEFLEHYASERGAKLSTALSELLLHMAKRDKANPALVREALNNVVAP